MSADFHDTIGELRELHLDILAESEQPMYGLFAGGDPRLFTPDAECCAADEMARWKEDCARAERGESPSHPIPHCGTRPGYGIGTYTMTDERAKDWAERLERYIAQLEGCAGADE